MLQHQTSNLQAFIEDIVSIQSYSNPEYEEWYDANELDIDHQDKIKALLDKVQDIVKYGVTQARNIKSRTDTASSYLSRWFYKQPKKGVEVEIDPQEVFKRELFEAVKGLGKKRDSLQFTYGVLLLVSLVFLLGAAPWAIPTVFTIFFSICMPIRAKRFINRKYGFFLLDFCYLVNLTAATYLMYFPRNDRLGSLAYAMADGPVAHALIVWNCSWVFSSLDYTLSVLMHMLPGIALYCNRYFAIPSKPGIHSYSAVKCGLYDVPIAQKYSTIYDCINDYGLLKYSSPKDLQDQQNQNPNMFFWYFVAPIIFYCVWQLVYWYIVQVKCGDYIKRNGYETSYSQLAKRMQKGSQGRIYQFVRKGSRNRRILIYGFMQLMYTVGTLVLFIPIYNSFYLATLWQILKIVYPIYQGARYQCEKLPTLLIKKALQSIENKYQRQIDLLQEELQSQSFLDAKTE